MTTFWTVILIGLSCILVGLVVFLMIRPNVFNMLNSLNAILAMNSVVVALILVSGFVIGRPDSMVDIALSYAVLGFVTSVILAKYFGGKRK